MTPCFPTTDAAQAPARPAVKAWTVAAALVAALAGGAAQAADHDAHSWSYDGDTGPAQWATLLAENAACAGEQQSPVDLTGGLKADLAPFELDWKADAAAVVNNGHTLQLDTPDGGDMVVNGKAYHLKQFHFHTQSEHLIDGRRSAMEAHFVNVADDGSIAVLGVMMEPGEPDTPAAKAFAEIMKAATAEKGEAALATPVAPTAFLPYEREYFRYRGSLTTPPCSETVLWTVLETPVKVHADDIKRFAAIFPHNNRPPQELNRRYLLVGK